MRMAECQRFPQLSVMQPYLKGISQLVDVNSIIVQSYLTTSCGRKLNHVSREFHNLWT
jgi:hypothetical protein